MSFWDELFASKKMVIGLSPMDGVTDVAMRYMSAKYGRPDILITEFVSVDALHYATNDPTLPSASKGRGRRERLLRTFIRAQDVAPLQKRPYEIAQVFGHTPELFAEAAELVESLGFDGIDINMGCPMHKVEDQGSGAGLIRTPKLAQEIIQTVKAHTKLPVSVKTRIGVDRVVVEEWMEQLMEAEPANISLHGRTLRQLYQGSADWEAIGRAAEVVHKHGGHILGNGDIESVSDLKLKAEKYKVDGGLIGRAAEGNPGIFLSSVEPSKEQRLVWMVEHARLYERIFKEENAYPPSLDELRKGTRQERWFLPVRKHLAWYCKGFEGAVEMRSKLMMTNSAEEVEKIVESIV